MPSEAWWETLPVRSRTLGQPVVVQLQDVPITVFAVGMPELTSSQIAASVQLGLPPGPFARKEWDAWADTLLARAIVAPVFLKDPVKIRELGEIDRAHLVTRLFARLSGMENIPYPRHFLAMVRKVALATRVPADDVLGWSTTKFWREYTILCSEGLEAGG